MDTPFPKWSRAHFERNPRPLAASANLPHLHLKYLIAIADFALDIGNNRGQSSAIMKKAVSKVIVKDQRKEMSFAALVLFTLLSLLLLMRP